MSTIDLATVFDERRGLGASLVRAPLWLFGASFPGLAARALEPIFLKPIVNTRIDVADGPFAPDAATRIAHGEARIATWSVGDGPVVLFIHGWGGRAAQYSAFVEPLVSAGYRIVAFDAPAHGASDGRRTHFMDFVAAAEAVVAAHGAPRAVVAHSFGAAVATWAVKQGLPAERLVLFAPPVDMTRFARFATRYVGFPHRVAERLQSRLERRFGVRWEELAPDRVAASLDLPLMVFHDEEDRQVDWRAGVKIAEAGSGTLVKSKGLGHSRILSDDATVAQAVDFLTARD